MPYAQPSDGDGVPRDSFTAAAYSLTKPGRVQTGQSLLVWMHEDFAKYIRHGSWAARHAIDRSCGWQRQEGCVGEAVKTYAEKLLVPEVCESEFVVSIPREARHGTRRKADN